MWDWILVPDRLVLVLLCMQLIKDWILAIDIIAPIFPLDEKVFKDLILVSNRYILFGIWIKTYN